MNSDEQDIWDEKLFFSIKSRSSPFITG